MNWSALWWWLICIYEINIDGKRIGNVSSTINTIQYFTKAEYSLKQRISSNHTKHESKMRKAKNNKTGKYFPIRTNNLYSPYDSVYLWVWVFNSTGFIFVDLYVVVAIQFRYRFSMSYTVYMWIRKKKMFHLSFGCELHAQQYTIQHAFAYTYIHRCLPLPMSVFAFFFFQFLCLFWFLFCVVKSYLYLAIGFFLNKYDEAFPLMESKEVETIFNIFASILALSIPTI